MNNKLMFITPEDERWYDLKDLPNEEWVNISFCKYCYISNYSRIKTLRYNKKKDCIKILKPWKNIHGYYVIRLTNINTGRRKNYTVSRLMGIIFLNVTSSKQEILHKNFVTKDTCDNRLCNLRVGNIATICAMQLNKVDIIHRFENRLVNIIINQYPLIVIH